MDCRYYLLPFLPSKAAQSEARVLGELKRGPIRARHLRLFLHLQPKVFRQRLQTWTAVGSGDSQCGWQVGRDGVQCTKPNHHR